ncbi:hypothetical protein TIFTF001_003967 [Ficus carica]|uniref:Uncharacterized protein n=1 Tax=Ficus carica TaxID=3494 RepID=A0AA87ZH27_FICCA|nr:hypothetical protein TIFTF001_003967 [Ficus carica]
MSSGILARAVVQAYRQALINASKKGVTQDTIRRGSKVMTEQEARQILGITEQTSWEEVLKVFENCPRMSDGEEEKAPCREKSS